MKTLKVGERLFLRIGFLFGILAVSLAYFMDDPKTTDPTLWSNKYFIYPHFVFFNASLEVCSRLHCPNAVFFVLALFLSGLIYGIIFWILYKVYKKLFSIDPDHEKKAVILRLC